MIDTYCVKLTYEAKRMLRKISKKYGKHTYEMLRDLINRLESNPEKQGQPLCGILNGYYSLHYSRFRIIYRIHKDKLEVIVIGAGFHESKSRKDIYTLIERLIESSD